MVLRLLAELVLPLNALACSAATPAAAQTRAFANVWPVTLGEHAVSSLIALLGKTHVERTAFLQSQSRMGRRIPGVAVLMG
jgi:hypothetical protein